MIYVKTWACMYTFDSVWFRENPKINWNLCTQFLFFKSLWHYESHIPLSGWFTSFFLFCSQIFLFLFCSDFLQSVINNYETLQGPGGKHGRKKDLVIITHWGCNTINKIIDLCGSRVQVAVPQWFYFPAEKRASGLICSHICTHTFFYIYIKTNVCVCLVGKFDVFSSSELFKGRTDFAHFWVLVVSFWEGHKSPLGL